MNPTFNQAVKITCPHPEGMRKIRTVEVWENPEEEEYCGSCGAKETKIRTDLRKSL